MSSIFSLTSAVENCDEDDSDGGVRCGQTCIIIIIVLVVGGVFLAGVGFLVCWLYKKFFRKDGKQHDSNELSEKTESPHTRAKRMAV